MIDLQRIKQSRLETEPYRWAAIDRLYSREDATALAATFPSDHFERRAYDDGEKEYDYDIRCLIRMGERSISRVRHLSSAWRGLAQALLSPDYRAALASAVDFDLSAAPLEVNVFRYSPGTSHGAHPDHRNKLVTHVLYFNESWNDDDGGCLTVLRSSDPQDIASRVSPLVGNSAVLVRSDNSWHAVSAVAKSCRLARHSLTATFYRPGCVSTVWPSWRQVLLHDTPARLQRLWGRLRARAA